MERVYSTHITRRSSYPMGLSSTGPMDPSLILLPSWMPTIHGMTLSPGKLIIIFSKDYCVVIRALNWRSGGSKFQTTPGRVQKYKFLLGFMPRKLTKIWGIISFDLSALFRKLCLKKKHKNASNGILRNWSTSSLWFKSHYWTI